MSKKILDNFWILLLIFILCLILPKFIQTRQYVGIQQIQLISQQEQLYEQTQQLRAVNKKLRQAEMDLIETKQDLMFLQMVQSRPSKAPWKIIKAEATAYSPYDNRDGNQASRGKIPHTSRGKLPGPHIMAVDPKRIPYGSELMLIYPDGTKIDGIAGDTGGALRSADHVVIDVFKYTYKQAREHSRQKIILLWKPRK